MFDGVAEKIKKLAEIIGWTFLGIGIVAWFFFVTNGTTLHGEHIPYKGDDIIGWICLFMGVVYFFSSWILYGFGELLECVSDIKYWIEKESLKKNGTTAE